MRNDKRSMNLVFQDKAVVVEGRLRKSVGIFAILKDGYVIISKCENPFNLFGAFSTDFYYKIVGITDSLNVGRDVEQMVGTTKSWVSRIFSHRDMTPTMLICELSETIEADFYDPENEKPFPVELLFLTLQSEQFGVITIRYNGERVIPSINEDKFVIFGCTDTRKKQTLRKVILGYKLSKMSTREFMKSITPKLSEFSGELWHGVALLESKTKKNSKRLS